MKAAEDFNAALDDDGIGILHSRGTLDLDKLQDASNRLQKLAAELERRFKEAVKAEKVAKVAAAVAGPLPQDAFAPNRAVFRRMNRKPGITT